MQNDGQIGLNTQGDFISLQFFPHCIFQGQTHIASSLSTLLSNATVLLYSMGTPSTIAISLQRP